MIYFLLGWLICLTWYVFRPKETPKKSEKWEKPIHEYTGIPSRAEFLKDTRVNEIIKDKNNLIIDDILV